MQCGFTNEGVSSVMPFLASTLPPSQCDTWNVSLICAQLQLPARIEDSCLYVTLQSCWIKWIFLLFVFFSGCTSSRCWFSWSYFKTTSIPMVDKVVVQDHRNTLDVFIYYSANWLYSIYGCYAWQRTNKVQPEQTRYVLFGIDFWNKLWIQQSNSSTTMMLELPL
jgi:hypothetical protein